MIKRRQPCLFTGPASGLVFVKKTEIYVDIVNYHELEIFPPNLESKQLKTKLSRNKNAK